MKHLFNPVGDLTMINREGKATIVASIKYGATYSLVKPINNSVIKVVIYTGGMQDEFFFLDDTKLVFHHLQTKFIMPNLAKCYLEYILKQESYSSDSFLKHVLEHYFKQVGYGLKQAFLVLIFAKNAMMNI